MSAAVPGRQGAVVAAALSHGFSRPALRLWRAAPSASMSLAARRVCFLLFAFALWIFVVAPLFSLLTFRPMLIPSLVWSFSAPPPPSQISGGRGGRGGGRGGGHGGPHVNHSGLNMPQSHGGPPPGRGNYNGPPPGRGGMGGRGGPMMARGGGMAGRGGGYGGRGAGGGHPQSRGPLVNGPPPSSEPEFKEASAGAPWGGGGGGVGKSGVAL